MKVLALAGAAILAAVSASTAALAILFVAVTGSGPGSSCDVLTHGGQQEIGSQSWNAEQLENARTITAIVNKRGLPHRAAVIAISTVIVESNLQDPHGGDRDSLGLFQQRPSMGWGSPEQVTNLTYATNKFLDHLVAIPGWDNPDPRYAGVMQQRVQRSAFPLRYAPKEPVAAALADQFWTGPRSGTAQLASTGGVAGPQPCADLEGGGTEVTTGHLREMPPGFQLPADPRQRAVVEFAIGQLGKPYVFGAKGPEAFDCSGLTQAAWAHAGVPISAGTIAQRHDGHAVPSIQQLQPGDLVFIPGSLGTRETPRHVGLYVGHGVIINAYDDTTGIVADPQSDWERQVVTIRRPAAALPESS